MATSTVVVAREDLTIPGAAEASGLETNDPEHIENELFKTLEQNKADAVLLDLTASQGQGVAAIRRNAGAALCPYSSSAVPKTGSPPIIAGPARLRA